MSAPKVTLNNNFFTFTQSRATQLPGGHLQGRLHGSVQNIPRAFMTNLHPAFAHGLWQGDQVTRLIPQAESNFRNMGHVVGQAIVHDAAGNQLGEKTVALDLGIWKLAAKCNHTIEMTPDLANGTVTRIERRMDGSGPREDASKVIYYLTSAAASQLDATGINLDQIRDVRVVSGAAGHALEIDYETATNKVKTLTLAGQEFYDSFRRPLLGNEWLGLSRPTDVYRGTEQLCGEETAKFRPKIEKIRDSYALIMHKVTESQHPLPVDSIATLKELLTETAERTGQAADQLRIKIFPSTVAAVAGINTPEGEVQVPINSPDPLPIMRLTWHGWENMFEPRLSQVKQGQTTTAIGPQNRLGNKGDLSLSYPRDAYFYGLWARDFALNRSKSNNFVDGEQISRGGGIESGRTHIIPYDLLYDPLYACFLETNNPYYLKLSSDDQWISGSGVSEDCKMELNFRAMGDRMIVYGSHDPVGPVANLMTAEKRLVNFDTQNTRRYDYSSDLFVYHLRYIVSDIILGKIIGLRSVLTNKVEDANIASGRLWYKRPFPALLEHVLIPLYLLSAGHIVAFPVDLKLFLTVWIVTTIVNNINYARHLRQLDFGKGFITGLFTNPVTELAQHWGYLRAAVKQNLERRQWGVFVATGKGVSNVPPAYAKELRGLIAQTGLGFAATVVYGAAMISGGLSILILPLAAVGINLLFNIYNLAIELLALRSIKRAYTEEARLGRIKNPKKALALREKMDRMLASKNEATRNKAVAMEKELKSPENRAPEFYVGLTAFSEQSPAEYETLMTLAAGLATDRSYDQAFRDIAKVTALMKKYQGIERDGTVAYGFDNKMRIILGHLMEVRTTLETIVVDKADRALFANHQDPAARAAVQKLLRQTKETVVVQKANMLLTQFSDGVRLAK